MTKLESALHDYVHDTQNSLYCFNVGKAYEELRQFAAAISFYLKTAEFGKDVILTYEALLRIALCLETQGDRRQPMKGALLRAITIRPNRPEAYFLITRMYEFSKEWHEAFAWSVIGENVLDGNRDFIPLTTDVQYPGRYGFIYERAVVTWWLGLYFESFRLFKVLKSDYKMLPVYEESVNKNILNITSELKAKGKL
jgi:tetratricopeptide (TPR) repeat protein